MNQEAQWLLSDKYNGIPTPGFEADLVRLQSGEPLAYVIGWVPFLGAKIYLDSLPLIPRAETEYWVSGAIDEIKKNNLKNIKVLDLCAGSGCIGVAVLKNIDGAQVDFVEIDTMHHETILKNINENSIDTNRTKIFGGNLFEGLNINNADGENNKYDFILTNPPYINPDKVNDVQKSVLDNEPDIALFGGVNGMEVVTEILQNAPKFLNKNGVLYIEHEPEQAEEIKNILPGIVSMPDQFRVIRYSIFKN